MTPGTWVIMAAFGLCILACAMCVLSCVVESYL